MEGDLTGRMEVEAGAHPLKINDSNKCHCLFSSIASPPAVNHEQADNILPAPEAKKAKKMPKTKKKFGRGIIPGTDRKQGRGNALLINQCQMMPQQLLLMAMFPLSHATNL